MLRILENELNNLKQIEEEIIKVIKEAPAGNFRCSKNRSYYQYYQGEKYLDKSKRDYVKKIAQREYYTIKGERVRSKSEKIIADELFRKGIPYKYEMPVNVLDFRGREIIIYPDFTVLNKQTGKRWIIEHFGLMDSPEYYDKAMLKLDTYERNGYYLGVNLLIFHETDRAPLNIKVMQNYIEYNLE